MTVQNFNFVLTSLKLSDYVVYHQVLHSELIFSAHRVHLYFFYFSEQAALTAL